MKKLIFIFTLSLLVLTSCSDKTQDYSYSIKDKLKISAWVLNEDLDYHDGYWIEDKQRIGHGWWISENEKIDNNEFEVFEFEKLRLNKSRIMEPLNYRALGNFSIYIEFDGIIEAKTDDKNIQLSYNGKNPSQPFWNTDYFSIVYENIKQPYNLCIDICAFESKSDISLIQHGCPPIGSEHYVDINAYEFTNESSPIIRAKLKFTVIEDKGISDFHEYNFDNKMSRFMSVEVVSYEYSDMYKIMDDIYDEEVEE